MPSPHRHVTMALAAQRNSVLDWRWLWANVATPILADPTLTTAYSALLDCLRAASTNQAGPIAPATSRALEVADDPTGHLIGAARHHANNCLEGLCAPVGIATQLLALQSAINTTGTNLNVSLDRPKAMATLQDKCPMLVASLLAACEVATTAALPMHWSKVHATLKPAEWAACHARTLDSAGSKTDKPAPLILPPMASDLGNG